MQAMLDCYQCLIKLALSGARVAGADEAQQRAVLDRTLDILKAIDLALPPPATATAIQTIIREVTGNADPYRYVKQASTQQALAIYPHLKKLVAGSADPLDTAIRLSIAGNIIDVTVDGYDLMDVVGRVLAQPFAIDHRPTFLALLDRARHVLYLADNAGETVFDRVLIEILDRPVTYVVRGGPVFNDALRRDALDAGLHEVARVVDNGSHYMGTFLDHCSPEFRGLFDRADLIISKGQSNYETVGDKSDRLFCLMQVKCPVIARDVGVPLGSIILRQGTG